MLDKIGNEYFAINHFADGRANVLCVSLELMLGPQFDVGVDQSGEEFVKEAGRFVGVHVSH